MRSQPGRLRIIGGSHRGRRIEIPAGARPTGDRIRESLFNIIANGDIVEIAGARVLDGCAGSGALGIEALSRGAAHAVFLDTDRAALRQIEANLDTLDLANRAEVRRMDVTRPTPGTPCEIVLLDPPYDSDIAQTAPAALAASGWIAEGGLCVVETRRGVALNDVPGFDTVDARSYGDTTLHFLVRSG